MRNFLSVNSDAPRTLWWRRSLFALFIGGAAHLHIAFTLAGECT